MTPRNGICFGVAHRTLKEETLASISIKRHWIILASLGVLLVAAVACGGGESGGGAAGKAGIDADAFRSF